MNTEDLTGRVFQNLEVLERASDYVGPSGKHEAMWRCKCLLCGCEIETRARNLKSGHIKSCGKKHRRVEDLTGRDFGDLHVIERAENAIAKDGTSYVMWCCLCKCGNTVVVRATSLKNGHTKSCGVCSRSRSNMGNGLIDITNKTFGFWHVIEKSRSLVQPNGRRVTLWKCQCRCGEIRELRAGTLKQGLSYSCGCRKLEVLQEKARLGFGISKAEKVVSQCLKNKDVYYEPQKTFADLRGSSGYLLSYDFAVYNRNMELIFLIECQGIQHYKPVDYFGGEKRFFVQQQNDNLKRDYARKMGVQLLEIPYFLHDNETIQYLDEQLKGVL